MSKDRIILFDIDDTIRDREGEIYRIACERYPNLTWIHPRDRTTHRIRDQYKDPNQLRILKSIYCSKGFGLNLPIYPAALEAIECLMDSGAKVILCTSEVRESLYDREDKETWVSKVLGTHFRKSMIFTPDKTLIRGHALVDDFADVRVGNCIPEWKLYIYKTESNLHHLIAQDLLLFTWDMWHLLLE